MKQILKRLFGKAAGPANVGAAPPVSIDRLHQMLQYARRRNLCGRGSSGSGDRWVGQMIEIVSEQRNFTAHANNPYYEAGTDVTQYRSVSWSFMPHHLAVYLVDGVLEFRASHEGRGPRETMPFATDAEDLAEIKRCFDHWYDEFDLPGSLDRPVKLPKNFEPSGDAMSDIQTYLSDGSVQAFHDLFEDDNPVVWVDWGEDDDNIIRAVAGVLGLDDLTACLDNENCDLLITYGGTEHRVRYSIEGIAERDTTIIALNAVLQPRYELRVCNASRRSDTLALMALSAEHWSQLEATYPAACAKHFAVIGDATVIFGRTS